MRKYDASSIKIFKGLSAVRKRPGMYIGNTDDGSALHRMIFEVIDNSIDEGLAGFCSLIKVSLHLNGFITVFDNGRGLPIDTYKSDNKSTAEIIMTVLHAGAKFDEKSYTVSGGLHGVGISVVNALSSNLCLHVFRCGFVYEQIYFKGRSISNFKIIGHTDMRGTKVTFIPDSTIFKFYKIEYATLFFRFKELSFLNPNVKIFLIDERLNPFKEDIFYNKGGIKSFVEYLNEKLLPVHKDVIFFFDKKYNISVAIAMQWVFSFSENVLCYTNNIYQKDGGVHLISFRNSLTKILKFYIEDQLLKSKVKISIQSEDVREGLVAIVSLYMNNPKFSSQIKDRLISAEVKQAIDVVLSSQLKAFLVENSMTVNLIFDKIISAARAREAAKKARDLSRKNFIFEGINLCTRLSDCQEKNPVFSELFLVEGESAGGSAKQARDRRNQAILPLKGKILNVEKSGFDKILSSSEIVSVISALKCGVEFDEYDEKKLRYHKIIFMTDADVDGSHIRTLLITFFYRHMPSLIESGYVFVSKPPLYRLLKGNVGFYIKDKDAFQDFLFSKIFDEFKKKMSVNVDLVLLKSVLNLYKDLMCIFDKLSHNLPRIFFESLLFFDKNILYDSYFLDVQIIFLQDFFNKILYNDQKLVVNIDFFYKDRLKIKHFKYNVQKEYILNYDFFLSGEYNKIFKFYELLKYFFNNVSDILFNDKVYHFYDFNFLFEAISYKIMSEYKVQRYKGLGEMNPEQLWETTMNPKTRNLQVVKIKDILTADSIFASLMGENIEDRRKLIENYAVSFSDIDI